MQAFLTEAPWTPVTTPGERSKVTYIRAPEAWTHAEDVTPPFAPVITPPVRRLLRATDLSRRRTRQIGIRYWDDRATGADRVRMLAEMLIAGEVSETVLTQFRRAYEDAWTDAVAPSTQGTPLDTGDRAPLIVTRGSQLDVIDLRGAGEPVYVQDTDARQGLQLLEQCAAPVLRLRDRQGPRVAARLEQVFGRRIRRVSQITLTIRIDGHAFTPSEQAPLLVGNDSEWFVDLVAAVIELRSGGFRRRGTDALRRSIALLRRIRLVLVDEVEADIDGHAIKAGSADMHWLTAPDDEHPTVILKRQQDDDAPTAQLERTAAPTADLLGLPELAAPLRLALIDLARLGYGITVPPDNDVLAKALSEPPERIREIRQAIRLSSDVAMDILIPLVAVWDLLAARGLDAGEEVPATPAELSEWLAERADGTINSVALLAAAADGDLDRARQALGIPLVALNAAIRELGPPYRELTDPEGVTQQFRHFVTVHKNEILDALRHGYVDDYRAGRQLDRYLELRDLRTLTPDPAWVEQYLAVPDDDIRARVNEWLLAADAQLGDIVPWLEPVETVRADNRARVLRWLTEATDLVRAWEQTLDLQLSDLPGNPAETADAAAASGLLDFEPISCDRFLGWLHATSRWPADMPRTLDVSALGLTRDDLDQAKRARDQARQRREDSRRRITLDGADLLADEANYTQIIASVKKGITEGFLASPAAADLVALAPTPLRATGTGRPGTTAGRRTTPSPAQTAAIGLAGEVAALEWLKAHYPGVTDDAWVSGYRNQVLGDGQGDDTLGYDLVIDTDKHRLMFEVKATAGDSAEFVLTDVEMLRAQSLKRRERYHVLFVSHALDSDLRQIRRLPNPLDPHFARFYHIVGQGLRYRFRVADHSR